MRRLVNSYTAISQGFGVTAPGTKFGRHLGTDYAGPEDRDIIAPVAGVITRSYLSAETGNVYEIKEDGNGRLHRLMHLKTRPLGVGARVYEGQIIAKSGGKKGAVYSGSTSTGPHAHWDIRKANTTWDASFDNYYDSEKLLTPPASTHRYQYLAGKQIKLTPKNGSWSVYRAGTEEKIGNLFSIPGADGVYTVRGVDVAKPGRVLVNSAKFGNGISLPLASATGQEYSGEWKII